MKNSSAFPYRRRARASLIPLIQCLSLVLVFGAPMFLSARVYTASPPRYDRITVRSGDTLWTLAAGRTSPGADVGEAVYELAALNGIRPGAQLRPGKILRVPQP